MTDFEYGDGVFFAVYETVQSISSSVNSGLLDGPFYFTGVFDAISGSLFQQTTNEIIDDFGGLEALNNITAGNIMTFQNLFAGTFF